MEENVSKRTAGQVKWYDPVKGFGFMTDSVGGQDIQLHANVLRNFGIDTIADGSNIEVTVQQTQRGAQVTEIHSVEEPEPIIVTFKNEFLQVEDYHLEDLPLEPARIKWHDKSKGFGFANIFRNDTDVFLHNEVLMRAAFSDPLPGEAVGLRVIDTERGKLAVQIMSWDQAQSEPDDFKEEARKKYTDIKRDNFDMLRDLDNLLGELSRYISSINDPDRISNDMRYVSAAAKSLQCFVDAHGTSPSSEVPKDLPQTLSERIKSTDWSKVPQVADKIAQLTQRIVDLISRVF
ncbi:cold-shock protein [Yoonia algicola]|uniref:Cold shock domain-containing protein n=1 Tax=Yoonia algicola TaxID=3137368 RepID=A0AAN0NFY1_9RHOB